MSQEIEQNQLTKGKFSITGGTLKIIAIITMLIDHIGATGVWNIVVQTGSSKWRTIYIAMRQTGRIAFPIFCFLLVEGFIHTRNRKKYLFRLGIFALLSEIPFDLAFSRKILSFSHQNVFFTLSIAFLCMMITDKILKKESFSRSYKIVLAGLVCICGMLVAYLLKTDYAEKGIVSIMVLYYFRNDRPYQILAGICSFLWEISASLAFIPIAFYNGKRGRQLKYFFYLFYPLHLLLLAFLFSM